MFCPTCGKDNLPEVKFCASCGTNLEVITRALYKSSVGFYTRFDSALDQFIGRYSERVFKSAPTTALSRRPSDSWKILGEGLLTSGVDFVLFWLMLFVVFPLRMLTLILSTPFRLFVVRGNRPKPAASMSDVIAKESVKRSDTGEQVPGPVSIADHTTEHLPEYLVRRRGRDSIAE